VSPESVKDSVDGNMEEEVPQNDAESVTKTQNQVTTEEMKEENNNGDLVPDEQV